MTPPPSVDAGLARAHQALAEARDLHKLGHYGAAVSRAYYATLYASLALLKSIGVEAKTHDGVMALVGQHFVRPGKLPAGTSRMLKHLEGDRQLADYDLNVDVSAGDASASIADATRYVDDVAKALAA